MKISLIIPAYNEEKRIKKVINSYLSFLDNKYDYELIFVCDGTDDTTMIVKNIADNNPHMKLLEFPVRQGKGGAIIQGLKEAKGEFVGFVDSDESVLPSDFEKLMQALKYADCVIASRRAKGARILIPQPWKRRLFSKVFNIIVNMLFNLEISDTQCGAKVFKNSIIKPILPIMRTKGFEFDVELLWRIKNRGFIIKEVPIDWKHEKGSTFSLNQSGAMFLNLLKIRFV